jgi:hypothetical protein
MTRRLVVLFLLTVVPTIGAAQQPTPAAGDSTPAATTEPPTVRLQVVLARYADKKLVASEPYELLLVANGQRKSLRTGAEVPIADGAAGGKENSGGYKSIGTNITVDVGQQSDGRFRTSLIVSSSSVYPAEQKQPDRSAFRTYLLNGEAFLREGVRTEIATATDSLTGEVIKAEVTVTTVK